MTKTHNSIIFFYLGLLRHETFICRMNKEKDLAKTRLCKNGQVIQKIENGEIIYVNAIKHYKTMV